MASMSTPSSLAYRYGSPPQIRRHMSLPPVNTAPAIDVRISGVPARRVGRYASSSGSTWGVPGASTRGGGSLGDGCDGGVAVRLTVGDGVCCGIAVAVASALAAVDGRGEWTTMATSVADGEGAPDPAAGAVQAQSAIAITTAADRTIHGVIE